MQLASRWATLWLLAFGCGLGAVILAAPHPAVAQDREAWVPITILYNSDVKGFIEPCG